MEAACSPPCTFTLNAKVAGQNSQLQHLWEPHAKHMQKSEESCALTAFPCSTCSAHLRITSFGRLHICVMPHQPLGCCLWWKLRFGNALQPHGWLVQETLSHVVTVYKAIRRALSEPGQVMHCSESLPKLCQCL